MEEKFQLLSSSMEGVEVEVEVEVEEFYEKIEAPKFVDFTVPNHFCPDDRFWFCSRVGLFFLPLLFASFSEIYSIEAQTVGLLILWCADELIFTVNSQLCLRECVFFSILNLYL